MTDARPSAKLGAVFAVSASDVLWLIAAVVFVGGLAWLARRIDPHWVAKDGRAFTCRVQPMRSSGVAEGRWREARAIVDGDRLRLVVRGVGQIRKEPYEQHEVLAKSASPPPRSAVFVVDGDPMWAVRVPAGSKAVAVMESLISP